MIPPQANTACVWAMEDVLEVDTRPDDSRRPQGCLDETSKQLVAETREPIPAAPGPSERVADASARKGTAHLCRLFAPLAGQRQVKVPARRTALDFTQVIQELVDGQSPQAEPMVLVMDHLNTHTPASLYEAFAPAEARRLMERLDIHDTPKHGRWLNMAEAERSVLAPPRLDRRIPASTPLTHEVAAWERPRYTAFGMLSGAHGQAALGEHGCHQSSGGQGM